MCVCVCVCVNEWVGGWVSDGCEWTQCGPACVHAACIYLLWFSLCYRRENSAKRMEKVHAAHIYDICVSTRSPTRTPTYSYFYLHPHSVQLIPQSYSLCPRSHWKCTHTRFLLVYHTTSRHPTLSKGNSYICNMRIRLIYIQNRTARCMIPMQHLACESG